MTTKQKVFVPKLITFSDLHKVMKDLDGYVERGGPSGHDGNITKIWADLQPSFQGQPWCAATDCYIWKHAGDPFPAIDHPWGFSYCPDGVNWFKDQHLWDADGHYEPGDTSFWDFTGHGVAEHTGTVIIDHGAPGLFEFEGNTSPSAGGSQSNGGGAYFKTRLHGATLMGVGKSSVWLKDHPNHKPKPDNAHSVKKHNPYTPNHHQLPLRRGAGGESVKWAQWALGVHVDGEFGKQTESAVKLFKRNHGIHSTDGVIRDHTAAALMHRVRTVHVH